ncbi:MAG: ABC transporter ATP-binding protein, partial [Sporomusa sp.]
MIEFRNVSYSYRKNGGKNIDDLNFTIRKGEFVLITGKSGSGKTTVSKCINGLIPYFHEGIMDGDVFVGGENTKGLALYEIGEKVGSVFQDPRSQFFTTNTTDEVAFGCQNLGIKRDEIFKRITDAFASLQIVGLRDRSIFELSSGEKQKIAIASCQAMNPCVYVLDEPSANLDIESIDQLSKILRVLKNSGTTIVVIEHRLYYLRELVDRIIYIDAGKIAGTYTAADIEDLNGK